VIAQYIIKAMSTIKKTINNPLGADLIQFFIKNKKKDATNLTH
jgi:hypothetical protein